MRKFYFILILMALWPAVIFAQTDTWDGTATIWTNGSGTETNPYLIESAEHLAYLAKQVNAGTNYSGQYFKLTTDLDMDNRQWIPIGSAYNRAFSGTFDGNGRTIAIQAMTASIDDAGIFGYVEDGTILNLGATGSWQTDARFVGAIAGEIYNATLRGCYNTGSIEETIEDEPYVGGIVGIVDGNSTLSDCYNTGSIKGTAQGSNNEAKVGGIAGLVDNNSTLTNCYNGGTVEGTSVAGQAYAGGIVGLADGSSTFISCYNMGSVAGKSEGQTHIAYAGGVAGYTSSSAIEGCYNMESVTATAPSMVFVGGLSAVADNATLTTGYNIGAIQGTASTTVKMGGIAGDAFTDPTLENVYYLSTSVASGNTFGTSRTAEQMQSSDFLAELDPEGAYFSGVQNEYPRFLQVVTLGVENVTANTATVKGRVVEDFTANSYYFAYKKATDADYTEFAATLSGSDFTANLIALEPSTTYKYYFLARTSTETIFGAEKEFTTACPNQFAGSGTEADPYRIEYACQLNQLAEFVNNLATSSTYRTKHYKLMADLVITDEYTPIGNVPNRPFEGVFDGNGHTIEIQNMTNATQYAGVFGYVTGATIRNLGAAGSWSMNEEGGFLNNYIGGIVGYAEASTISGCYNSGNISVAATPLSLQSWRLGGVVGYAEASTISGCYNSGNLSGTGNINLYMAGVVGFVYSNTSAVRECYNMGSVYGEVNGNAFVAGVIADVSSASAVSECYNAGSVSGKVKTSASRFAGVVGKCSSAPLISCYNTGEVTGEGTSATLYVGGIVGESTSQTSGCYNTASLSGNTSGSLNIGGIAGSLKSKTIQSCYNVGSISNEGGSSANMGGIVGKKENSSAKVQKSYYLNTCGAASMGESRTEAEMKTPAFLAELDPEGAYFSGMQNGYPVLMQVVTDEVENVTANAATLKGHLEEGFTASSYHFAYKKATDADYTEVAAIVSGSNYTANLTALEPSTTYEYYFLARTSTATIFGSEKEFTTDCSANFAGSGTEADPYRIEYACQLNKLATLVNNLQTYNTYKNKHYKLMANLVITDEYTPIGNVPNRPFEGVFDGNGHTIEIQNMAIGIQYAGIFGYVRTATIYNLGATGSWSSDAEYAGGIVGYMHSSTVRGCYNTGDISGTRIIATSHR